jgi:hypothetical protein
MVKSGINQIQYSVSEIQRLNIDKTVKPIYTRAIKSIRIVDFIKSETDS